MAEKVTTVDQMVQRITANFDPSKAAGVNAVFQFDITGEGGGKYYIAVADNQATLHEGEHAAPTTTMIASANDYMAITNGELNAMTAFTMQKLKIKGDMGMALKFQQLFPQG
ncbi:MAG: SCP2 sterol-binding domain-containing protein [Anaerolineae bacterium]|nr:SCP2 sterol-binding domain-containing protein [Anaerolineae bacterium]